MSLGSTFTTAAAPHNPKPRKPRPAPFSLRLSDGERAQLVRDAGDQPLGTYVKARLFDGMPAGRKRRKDLPMQDREALAQALALLGRSRLSSNLNQLAHAVNLGVLPVTPENEAELLAAVQDVRAIRTLLMTALGHKSGDEVQP